MRYLQLPWWFRVLPMVVGMLLAPVHGVGPAVAWISAGAAVAALLGAWLLRTSVVGAIGWRNVLASWLLPWGSALGGGSLPAITATSWLVCSLMGVIGAVGQPTPWLMLGLLLDAIALVWLARVIWRRYPGRVERRVVRSLAVGVLLLAAGGFAANAFGHPVAAAWIAGGPLAILGGVYGLYVAAWIVFGPSRLHG